MAAKRIKAGNRNKLVATTQPVKAASEQVEPWDRDIDLVNGYRGLTVEVVSRANNVLSFNILNEGVGAKRTTSGAFTVDLDDGEQVWGSLPSTAQDVDPISGQRVGYLFVALTWLKSKRLVVMDLPKWPRGLSI